MKVAAVHCNPKIKPALSHNDRTDDRSPNILHELTHKNEYKSTAKEVRAEIDKFYKEAESNFYEYCKNKNGISKSSGKPKGLQNFTEKEKSYHEFIYEIGENTTMEQCQKLSDEIAKLTGFRVLQIAIHRDEGHIDEKGNQVIHHHAHAVFFTLDKDSGLQLARQQASLHKGNLSKFQTLASEIFGMERGEKRFEKGIESPKYIADYKIYKQTQQQKQRDLVEIEAKKEKTKKEIEKEKAEMKAEFQKERNLIANDKNKLEKDKKEYQHSLKELEAFKNDLNKQEMDLVQKRLDLEKGHENTAQKIRNDYASRHSLFLNLITFGKYHKRLEAELERELNRNASNIQAIKRQESVEREKIEKRKVAIEREMEQYRLKLNNTERELERERAEQKRQKEFLRERLSRDDFNKLYEKEISEFIKAPSEFNQRIRRR